ncbi:RNA-binding protein 5-like isoform X3 [Pomacea canaliculata]|uniref:RNA-binding protein 5-like isoform X3 n=1 Tax=Pomacea canaliculata TaxID=400727 RepID=UPI000D72F866|nr:RNA-binding protein 5-like isoform X3 [Pomacea canaliculata]
MYYNQYPEEEMMMDQGLPGRDLYGTGPNFRRDMDRFDGTPFQFEHAYGPEGFENKPQGNERLGDYFRHDSGSFPLENEDFPRESSFQHHGNSFQQQPGAGLPQQNFPFDSEAAGYDSRNGDRERERDRSRRQGRDRQKNNRRDEGNWERRGRRDRGDRDWSGDRDRRRDRRSSRDRNGRDRSPKDDNMDMGSDDSRLSDDEIGDHRSHSRDRDRSKRDHDDDRDRLRNWDDRDRHGEREGERWMTETPSATILLRGLNNSVTENDVITELVRITLIPKDVRFMRRATGTSRGFGFVEFHTQSEAQRWMDLNQGLLVLPGISQRITMHYSAPRVGRESRDSANRMDWMCKCGAHNFKRRDFCYKCNTNRRIAEDPLGGVTELDAGTHVGKTPCNTLLFRDLDALTTEQGILQAIAALTSMPIKNVQVIRDEMNTSRCFAFLELNSVASAKQLCEFFLAQIPPLAIDGKQVLISYAKNTFSTSLDIIQKAQAKVMQNAYYMNYNYYSQDGQYYNYTQFYGAQGSSATANSANAAAAVAQTAIMQAQAAKNIAASASAVTAAPTVAPAATATAVITETSTEDSTQQYQVYPAPDVSTYQYDKTSGYYYDPSTGLYYDANSQYYYNPKTSQFMYWDAEKSTYLPAPTQTGEAPQTGEAGEAAASENADLNKDKKEKKEKEKVKVAKKIAKDMEKWAKSMNAQKEALKEEQRKISNLAGRKESAAADAGFAILQKSKEDIRLMPPPPMTLVNAAPEIAAPAVASQSPAAASKAGLVASYGGDSDDSGDDEDGSGSGGHVDEAKLVDWNKLACLLCKRQFQSKEILTKHTQFSDLHKQNLESLKAKSASRAERKEYRDRAKERREKYGTPAPPEPKKQAQIELPEVYEQPTKLGIGTENIGNKMLQKMGWAAGQGLGKDNQGRTAPVEVNVAQCLLSKGENVLFTV